MMVWVASGVADAAHRLFGDFAADEWGRFCQALGLRWLFGDLPEWLPAYRINNLIVIRRGMSPAETAWWVWHELGHWLMHPGNVLSPLGDPNVGKQECQANDFARLFPVWDASLLAQS